ncbi:MAG: ATP-binding protein [Acidobacteria bacterium]|nr:ATP-binding protein [Acidobacteriota bacterium]
MKKKKNTSPQQTKNECKLRDTFYMLIFFLLSVTLFGQTNRIRFKHLSVVDGLSQGVVNSILQDQKGFIWIGTQDGLNRYDGYIFKVYKNAPNDDTSISDKYILCLYEDKDHNLWIGTRDGGLNRYNRETDNFMNYKNAPTAAIYLRNYDVKTICEGTDDILWVGTLGGGLLRLDKKKNEFKRYTTGNGLSDNNINIIFKGNDGKMWIGAKNGLYSFDQTTGKSSDENSINNNVTAICEGSKGSIWIGTEGGNVYMLDGSGRILPSKYNAVKSTDSALYNPVHCLFEDTEGILWIGTQRRLIRFNPENREATEYENDISDSFSLNNNEVLSIYRDNTGITWLGTYGGGLNIYDPAIHRFKLFNKEHNNLSQNLVWAILKDASERLWIGTYGGGLNLFDPKTGKFSQYIMKEDVRCIHEDKYTGILWIGTHKNGLLKFNPESKQIEKKYSYGECGLSDKGVICIFQTRPDEMWLGTLEKGLNKFNPMTGDFTVYNQESKDPQSLSNDYVRAILEDNDGKLWVGTDGGGVNLLIDPDKKTFRRYLHEKADPLSLSHNRIKSIYQDKLGRIWIGTEGGGLNLLEDKEKGQFKAFGLLTQGVPNDTVYGILEDELGNLWISTTNGLFTFSLKPSSKKKPAIKNYDFQDGLQSNEFNDRAFFKNKKSGEMFFGGTRGFNSFLPQDIKEDTNKPTVILTDFLLFNISQKPRLIQSKEKDSPLKNAINETESITLRYKQSSITFEFAAISYANPLKNRYKYKMEGYDSAELETDAKNRRATYTNLPAGKYTFKVKGSNKDGIWNDKDASIQLKILPPPWKTWWAYTIYVIACGLMLFLIWAAWSKHFLKRKVEEQTQKLKDAQEHLIQSEKMATVGTLLSGVAHELNNPTAYIKMNSEFFNKAWKDIVPILDQYAQTHIDYKIAGLLFKDSKEDIRKLIIGLMEGSVRIKNLIDELKIFSRKEDPLKKEAVDINRVIRSSIDLIRHDIGKATNNFSYQLGEGLPVIYGNSQRLERVFINLIENACQALTNNIQGIFISTMYDITASQVLIKVKDEGRGIDEKNLKHITDPFFTTRRESGGIGLGLWISLQIVQEHGGTIKFGSTPGEGTTVFVQLPVNHEEEKRKI